MAAKPNRRWIFAVVMAVLFPALAIHVSCVAVIGPGSWGSGMEQKLPQLLPGASNPVVEQYAREFANAHPPDGKTQEETTPHETTPGLAAFENSLHGKVFWTDRLAPENLAVVATYEGPTWVENQHFYLWQGSHPGPAEDPGQGDGPGHEERPATRELDLAPAMILEQPTLLKRHGQTILVVARWLPWGVPPLEKLSRYVRSYLDPTLRPETSLYLYPLPSGPLAYWGPGHTLKPSPDRRLAILLRSGAMAAGYYSMHLWDFEQDHLTTILSLREADPGSGRSFDYEWSADSRAVHITGATGGFERRKPQPRSLDLIYLVGDETVYDLAPSK
jgi:hypothetical protein